MDPLLIGGTVKDGVVIPDRPLAEGTYVEMKIPNAPRELVEGVRWDRNEQTATRPVNGVNVDFGLHVEELLRHHHAEADFAGVVRCIRETFPDVARIVTRVREDHESSGLFSVECRILFPAGHPVADFSDQKRFYQAVSSVVPKTLRPLFHHRFENAQQTSPEPGADRKVVRKP